jgi:NADH-quinone oxidoreductase subunit M
MVFLLLTLFVFPICILASWHIQRDAKYFFCHLLLMELLLILTFTTTDLFYFYVFFESLLIPMFSMIGV